MRVKLKAFSTLKKVIHMSEGYLHIEVKEGSTIQDFLMKLNRKYGATFRQEAKQDLMEALKGGFGGFNVFLNGKNLQLPDNSNLKLRDEDEIVILQPIGGG